MLTSSYLIPTRAPLHSPPTPFLFHLSSPFFTPCPFVLPSFCYALPSYRVELHTTSHSLPLIAHLGIMRASTGCVDTAARLHPLRSAHPAPYCARQHASQYLPTILIIITGVRAFGLVMTLANPPGSCLCFARSHPLAHFCNPYPRHNLGTMIPQVCTVS